MPNQLQKNNFHVAYQFWLFMTDEWQVHSYYVMILYCPSLVSELPSTLMQHTMYDFMLSKVVINHLVTGYYQHMLLIIKFSLKMRLQLMVQTDGCEFLTSRKTIVILTQVVTYNDNVNMPFIIDIRPLTLWMGNTWCGQTLWVALTLESTTIDLFKLGNPID